MDKNLTNYVRHFFINKTGTTILEYDPITDGCNKEVGVNSRKSSQVRALFCAHSPSLKNRGRFPRLQISFSSMTNPVMRA